MTATIAPAEDRVPGRVPLAQYGENVTPDGIWPLAVAAN